MTKIEETLENYSGADYVDGACLSLENGKRHFDVSDKLSDSHFGIAIAHLILGAEEYIKAMLLLNLSGDDYFLTKKEKIMLFKQHKFKHKNIGEFLKSLTDESVTNFETNLFSFLTMSYSPDSKFTRDGYFINKVWSFSKLEEKDVDKVMNWLKNANDLKNQGFYLDLKEEWKSPARFTKSDYEKSEEIVGILRRAIEPLFEMPLTDDEFLDFLNY